MNYKIDTDDKEFYPAVVGVPKSLLKLFEDSTGIMQTFWSPTTKLYDSLQLRINLDESEVRN